MSRPPIYPETTAAGIAVDPRTLERVIPESRRPDGSYVAPHPTVMCRMFSASPQRSQADQDQTGIHASGGRQELPYETTGRDRE